MLHVDLLPIHPQPESLESLTSYLMYLANENGIRTMDGFGVLVFPKMNRRSVRKISDFGLASLCNLALSSGHTEAELQATTLQHLCRKFNRSTNPQTVSRFLSISVATHLRWCPFCLQEGRPYYRLTWRFLELDSCPLHACGLLEACQRCGKRISLFHTPFAHDHCPYCENDLRKPDYCDLGNSTFEKSKFVAQELNYLLVPQKWEAQSQEVMAVLGQLFRRIRIMESISLHEVAQCIGTSISSLECVESANTATRGANFDTYIRYANLFGVSLSDVINEAIDCVENERNVDVFDVREEMLLRRVNWAIDELLRDRKPISQRAVSRISGISRATLQKYSRVVVHIKSFMFYP